MSCAICFEHFKGSDNNLYSTTCGHIYHFACMQQWKSRSTSCPQCRAYNPKTHKIYLELNDDEPSNSRLKEQLRECQTKIQQLEMQNKKGNKGVSTNNTIKCQMLEETLETTLEHNSSLEKQLDEANVKISNMQIQINTLKRSLNGLGIENNNLQLNVASLQAEHNRLKDLNETPYTYLTSQILALMRKSSLKIMGAQIIPGSNLNNFVYYIGRKMDVYAPRSEIIRTVFVKEENTLLVQFKEAELRTSFYKNAYKLRYYNETVGITFRDITDNAFGNTLFDYALNLKMFNYRSVFRQNKQVMARKDDDEEPIRIYSKEHVEDLIEEEEGCIY